MSEQRVITPFELGVCAALQVIGTSLATLDPSLRSKIEDTAKTLIAAMPADKSIVKDRSAHHLPLESLIQGLFPERNLKSDV